MIARLGRVRRAFGASVGALLGGAALIAPAPEAAAEAPAPGNSALENVCTADAMQAVVGGLPGGVTVGAIKDGTFKGATRFVAASGSRPAFCQVTGSFVTNPASGKTANFMATLPAAWNGKYLQLGCSGHCGQFYVSDPALPTVTVTAQGHPGQLIEKGYAVFATDEGHAGLDGASWAVKPDGSVDQDAIDDFLFRADKVLVTVGKGFTKAFYGRLDGKPQEIAKSYFEGCSGGGRDAMVVASYFPEAFDGIIAGSPYNIVGMDLQASAIGAANGRSPGAALSPALLALFDKTVKAQCDALDEVKDGLIQNPGACNFVAERDLPRCAAGSSGDQCFTPTQIETASDITSAVTDEHGAVVQPGYSVSELDVMPAAMAFLTNPTLKIIVHGNDPAFAPASIFSFRRGGPGSVTAFHAVVPATEVARVRARLQQGWGHDPANQATLLASKTKLLMWHNFSDEKLSPLASVNWYKQLARARGGYAQVQKQVRLFLLPGTAHCSMSSIAPNSFDAVGALETWVEQGQAPDALIANVSDRQFTPGVPKAPALLTPEYTMPLCKFPEQARYDGKGDKQRASSWSCRAADSRLLTVGESGRQAGELN